MGKDLHEIAGLESFIDPVDRAGKDPGMAVMNGFFFVAFGARLVLPERSVAPDLFDLIDMKNGDVFQCRIIWREYPQVGVVFESRERLENPTTPRLAELKTLWLNSLTSR